MPSMTLTLAVPAAARELNDAHIAHLRERALFVRLETVRLIEIAKVGHYASAFSAAEIFATLYYDAMRLRRGEPDWPDRDRFLMGKGHAAVGLYPDPRRLGLLRARRCSTATRASAIRSATTPTCARSRASTSAPARSAMRCRPDSAWRWARACRAATSTSSCCSATARCRRARCGKRRCAAAHHRARTSIAIVDRNGYQLDGTVDDIMGIEPLARQMARVRLGRA